MDVLRKYGLFLIFFFTAPAHANEIDLSTPEQTYSTCYATITLEDASDVEDKIRRCFTHTGQKSILSYAVLGAHFLDGLENKIKLGPSEFLDEINASLKAHNFTDGSRQNLKSMDLPALINDLVVIYTANSFVTQNLQYTNRQLTDLESADHTAAGTEVFTFKKPLPKNRLVLNFIKVNNNWLINHIAYK